MPTPEEIRERFPLAYGTLEEWDSLDTPTVEECLVAQRASDLAQFAKLLREMAAEWNGEGDNNRICPGGEDSAVRALADALEAASKNDG